MCRGTRGEPVAPHTASVERAASDESTRANYVLRLALNPQLWVQRRVERFEFIDARTARRHMSVDFALPASNHFKDGDVVYVPLLLPKKGTLRNLDVRDADGRALPVSTSEHDQEVAVDSLHAYFEGIDESEKPLDKRVLRLIVEESDPHTALETAERELGDSGELGRRLAAAPSTDPEGYHEHVRGLVKDLANGFLLLVHLPYSTQRTIVKIAFDSAYERETADRQRLVVKVQSRLTRVFSSLGLAAQIEVFDQLDVGLGRSYHAELAQPAEAYSAAFRLDLSRAGRYVEEMTDNHPHRPHVYARSSARGDAGRVTVLLYAAREGLLFPLWFSASVITTLLMLIPHDKDRLDAQTLATLLLLPVALSAYFVRSGEARYLTRALRGVRMVALVPLLCGLFAGALVALGPLKHDDTHPADPSAVQAICDVRWLSLGATALLTLSLVSPWYGARYRRFTEWLEARKKGRSKDRSRAGETPSQPSGGAL